MEANEVGRDHAGLRSCVARFARLRSANRALPATVSGTSGSAGREERANKLRKRLAALAIKQAPSDELAQALDWAMPELSIQLDEMERDLLERMDALDFVSLRASIPRSVESRRIEVLALLEVLLAQRRELLARIPKVEYLITALSTVEVDGQLDIVRDPVTLTPILETFTVDTLDPVQAEAVAMEFYQAATLDSDSENFLKTRRSLRSRKQAVGLACLCPIILRAMISYNVRMFNSAAAPTTLSRAFDSVLDEAFPTSDDGGDETDSLDLGELAEDLEKLEQESLEKKTGQRPVSVFDSIALQSVIDALRRRLNRERVGTGSAERVALVLDHSLLEPLEIAAIRAESPDADQKIVARTTVVGLMLRDIGPIEAEFSKLGIEVDQLSDAWVRELNGAFGQLLFEKLSDAEDYVLASKLSGIKSKHLFKPFHALRAGNRDAT